MALNLSVQRLFSQGLVSQISDRPEAVVGWFGAIQSQDFAGAKWAVGQRTDRATDLSLEEAYNRGAILRTHLMRPTWHFVLPEDIRWLLELTAGQVKTAMSSNDKREGLDSGIFSKCNDLLARALEGGQFLDRPEIAEVLTNAGVPMGGNRLSHILVHAELDQVICSGPRRGKQLTYALLADRAPQAKTLTREEALAELARRYFTSHGPALLKDFTWWSGLSMSDARKAISMNSSYFDEETFEGKTYWFTGAAANRGEPARQAALLPNYDEFTVGYSDRSAIYEEHQLEKFEIRGSVLNNIMLLDGCLAGTWKRTFRGKEVLLEMGLFHPLSDSDKDAFAGAVKRYREFLALPIAVNSNFRR